MKDIITRFFAVIVTGLAVSMAVVSAWHRAGADVDRWLLAGLSAVDRLAAARESASTAWIASESPINRSWSRVRFNGRPSAWRRTPFSRRSDDRSRQRAMAFSN